VDCTIRRPRQVSAEPDQNLGTALLAEQGIAGVMPGALGLWQFVHYHQTATRTA
jgi:hypothetical protein